MDNDNEQIPGRPSTGMRRFWIVLPILAIILIIGVVIAFLVVPATRKANPGGTQTPASSTSKTWSVVASPDPGRMHNGLNAVTALSASDAWAVGTFSNSNDGNIGKTLIEHWNGSRWNVVPSPNTTHTLNVLSSVAATSPDDVWAAGYATDSVPTNQTLLFNTSTLIEHWNGSQWSIVQSPSPGSTMNVLSGVVAIAPNDAWAAGYFSNSQNQLYTAIPASMLIEHWNGSQWSVVTGPHTGFVQNILNGVAAISANDIWAVGYFFAASTSIWQPLIMHWNGNTWSVVRGPNTGMPYSTLSGVTAASSSDVWAVGYSSAQSIANIAPQTLIEHWNGKQWSIIPSPNNPSANGNTLASVIAVSARDVWAVGSSPRTYPLQGFVLIEHWNGRQWSIVQGTNPSRTSNNYLSTITRVPDSNTLWAVGYYGAGDPEGTIIETHRL